MAKIAIKTEQLEGLKNPPAGIYEFRFDGFKPKRSKKGDSWNLRPQLVVINHPSLSDAPIFTHGNTAFGIELFDMCHALGVKYDNEGVSDEPEFPGDFTNYDTMEGYTGPIVGQIGKLEMAETTDQNGKIVTNVKRYFCRVEGCQMPHRDNLISK